MQRDRERIPTITKDKMIVGEEGILIDGLSIERASAPTLLLRKTEAGIKPTLSFQLVYDEELKRFFFAKQIRGKMEVIPKFFRPDTNTYFSPELSSDLAVFVNIKRGNTCLLDQKSVAGIVIAILSTDTRRLSAIIQNNGDNTVRVGDPTVLATKGIKLFPGDSMLVDNSINNVFAISEAGTNILDILIERW